MDLRSAKSNINPRAYARRGSMKGGLFFLVAYIGISMLCSTGHWLTDFIVAGAIAMGPISVIVRRYNKMKTLSYLVEQINNMTDIEYHMLLKEVATDPV